MKFAKKIIINKRTISLNHPTYFIADIAANHDSNLNRAKDLIWKAKKAGADAVKFQHFLAEKIVSDYGFRNLGEQLSHQKKWKKSVFDTYKKYSKEFCPKHFTETEKTNKIRNDLRVNGFNDFKLSEQRINVKNDLQSNKKAI